MLTVNPCPVCGKSMRFPPELNVCDHKWPEAITTTNNDELVYIHEGEFIPIQGGLEWLTDTN